MDEAMNKEMKSLEDNEVWELSTLVPGKAPSEYTRSEDHW